MAHKFVILRNGKLETYNDFEKIPKSFDNVISFEPDVPREPHTEEQHEEIGKWPERLAELMKREKK